MRLIRLAIALALGLALATLAEAQQTGRFAGALVGTPRSSAIPVSLQQRLPSGCTTGVTWRGKNLVQCEVPLAA
jgi:hypothetical protein